MDRSTGYRSDREVAETAEAPPPFQLTELTKATSPGEALDALHFSDNGFDNPRIQQLMRNIAVTLYAHQMLSCRYQSQIHNSRNTLLYFTCAMFRCRAPLHVQQTLEWKRLSTTEMVELYYWDCLYYAIVAEIRRLQEDVVEHFSRRPDSALELHTHGKDCEHPGESFTISDLAEQLREFWLLLMDHRLLGPLEFCARLRNLADSRAIDLSDHDSVQTATFKGEFDALPDEKKKATLSGRSGMYNVAEMEPQDIVDLLWRKHAPVIARACPEELGVEDWLANCRRPSSQRQQQTTPPSAAAPERCVCDDSCACQEVHQYGADIICNCLFQLRLRAGAVRAEETTATAAAAAAPITPRAPSPRPRPPRARADTARPLPDVPDAFPPIQKGKDPLPLHLYRGEQQGRYPAFVPGPPPAGGPPPPPPPPPPPVAAPPSPPREARPAPRQRWLRAGGDARMEEREEIEFSLGEVVEQGVRLPGAAVLATPRTSADPAGGRAPGSRGSAEEGAEPRKGRFFGKLLSSLKKGE